MAGFLFRFPSHGDRAILRKTGVCFAAPAPGASLRKAHFLVSNPTVIPERPWSNPPATAFQMQTALQLELRLVTRSLCQLGEARGSSKNIESSMPRTPTRCCSNLNITVVERHTLCTKTKSIPSVSPFLLSNPFRLSNAFREEQALHPPVYPSYLLTSASHLLPPISSVSAFRLLPSPHRKRPAPPHRRTA